jgi:hypothetical protein
MEFLIMPPYLRQIVEMLMVKYEPLSNLIDLPMHVVTGILKENTSTVIEVFINKKPYNKFYLGKLCIAQEGIYFYSRREKCLSTEEDYGEYHRPETIILIRANSMIMPGKSIDSYIRDNLIPKTIDFLGDSA